MSKIDKLFASKDFNAIKKVISDNVQENVPLSDSQP